MNRPRILPAIAICLVACCAVVRGQLAIPAPAKTATVIDAATGKIIDDAVAANFNKLLTAVPEARKEAREAIVNDARVGGGELSPAYAARYSQAVATEAMKKEVAEAPPAVRLNVAIAVARVAEQTHSAKLEAVALALMDEAQPEYIKLWGMRAARGIMPDLVKANAQDKLVKRMQEVVAKWPSGAITAEAYAAMQVLNARMIDAMLDLAEIRIKLYELGLPEDPINEREPFLFLGRQQNWNALTPAQKLRTLALTYRLLRVAALHADQAAMGSIERDQLIATMGQAGNTGGVLGSLQVWGTLMNDQGLVNAAKASLAMAGRGKATEAVKSACDALKAVSGIKIEEPKLDPPPKSEKLRLPVGA